MSSNTPEIPLLRKVFLSIVLLVCGLLVFVLGTNYFSVFPTNESQGYRVVLAAIFLGVALISRRSRSLAKYGDAAYAFFIAITVFFMTSLTAGIRDSLLAAAGVSPATPRYIAFAKTIEAIIVTSVILILMALWGADLGSLYLKKGRLGAGLFVGFCLLTINATVGIITGGSLGQAGDALVAQLPWALLFSLANGFMEELWFRGLFLRRFAGLIGVVGSILITSIVFTVAHAAATYMNPVEAVLFQLVIFPMALLFAYLMHKTDSIWGSVLYHAGSDTFLFYLMGF
jgi:membrane protease YdiL (CAAX protease family)